MAAETKEQNAMTTKKKLEEHAAVFDASQNAAQGAISTLQAQLANNVERSAEL